MCGCLLDNSFNFAVCLKYFRIRCWDLCPAAFPTGKPVFSHPDKQKDTHTQCIHTRVCPVPPEWFLPLSFSLGTEFSKVRGCQRFPHLTTGIQDLPEGRPTVLLVYPRLREFLGCRTSYVKSEKPQANGYELVP